MLEIGSISHGTHVSADLACALIGAMLSEGWTEESPRIIELRDVESGADTTTDSEVIADAMDDLDNCAPPYCYVGMHEGDGSDLGVWLSNDAIEEACRDGEILKLSDLSEIDDIAKEDLASYHYFAVVNDHGNVSLYPVVVTYGKALWDLV